jgi:hypothetical protein
VLEFATPAFTTTARAGPAASLARLMSTEAECKTFFV